jgi:hypothetical protein
LHCRRAVVVGSVLNGRVAHQELYNALRSHPKTISNKTYDAIIRRALQENGKQANLRVWIIEKGVK